MTNESITMHTTAFTLIFSLIASVSGQEASLRGTRPENIVVRHINVKTVIVQSSVLPTNRR